MITKQAIPKHNIIRLYIFFNDMLFIYLNNYEDLRWHENAWKELKFAYAIIIIWLISYYSIHKYFIYFPSKHHPITHPPASKQANWHVKHPLLHTPTPHPHPFIHSTEHNPSTNTPHRHITHLWHPYAHPLTHHPIYNFTTSLAPSRQACYIFTVQMI